MWCDICLEVHNWEAIYHLQCGHGFCSASLLQAYASYQSDPACPEPTCRVRVSEEDLLALVGPKITARILRLRIETQIRGDDSLRLCPVESCTQVLSAPKEKCEVFCEACDKLVSLDAVPVVDPGLGDVMSKLGLRICMSCGNGVEKKEGCDKMMCRCGAKFCFRCGAANATCNCTSEAHIFWDNVSGTREGAAFKTYSLSHPHRLRFRRRSSSAKMDSACCTIS